MITKLTGAATLFTAGALFIAGAPQLGATPVAATGSAPSLTLAGQCGTKAPSDTKAPAPKEKAKDGSCGKGTCGSKDMKKDQKQVSCGKAKKEASCGKSK